MSISLELELAVSGKAHTKFFTESQSLIEITSLFLEKAFTNQKPKFHTRNLQSINKSRLLETTISLDIHYY